MTVLGNNLSVALIWQVVPKNYLSTAFGRFMTNVAKLLELFRSNMLGKV